MIINLLHGNGDHWLADAIKFCNFTLRHSVVDHVFDHIKNATRKPSSLDNPNLSGVGMHPPVLHSMTNVVFVRNPLKIVCSVITLIAVHMVYLKTIFSWNESFRDKTVYFFRDCFSKCSKAHDFVPICIVAWGKSPAFFQVNAMPVSSEPIKASYPSEIANFVEGFKPIYRHPNFSC